MLLHFKGNITLYINIPCISGSAKTCWLRSVWFAFKGPLTLGLHEPFFVGLTSVCHCLINNYNRISVDRLSRVQPLLEYPSHRSPKPLWRWVAYSTSFPATLLRIITLKVNEIKSLGSVSWLPVLGLDHLAIFTLEYSCWLWWTCHN